MKRLTKGKMIAIVIGAILLFIPVYFIVASFEGVNRGEYIVWINNFNYLLNNPVELIDFKKYLKAITFGVYSIVLFFYFAIVALKILEKKKYRAGKEYGSAELADIKVINNLMKSKNDDVNAQHMIPYWQDKKQSKVAYINTQNRLISRNVMMSMDVHDHELNLNILIIGGSGAGKTQYWVRPNLMQMSSSFIVTDPKGEILKTVGKFLQDNGYRIIVLNVTDEHAMRKSNRYNPFRYITSITDIDKLVTNLIKNTTPSEGHANDPFWENAEMLLISALFKYTYLEAEDKSFRTVMDLLKKAEFKQNAQGMKIDSELDEIFNELEEKNKLNNYLNTGINECNHPAVIDYNKTMRGAADTVRSIIISVNVRLRTLQNDAVLELLSEDELNIEEIGAGVNYDGVTKTAVFLCTPDSDKTYNFIIGLLLEQVLQILYYYADYMTVERKLPIHVTLVLDEFYNTALPEDYLGKLSTMRSREISSIIIVQNLSQLKDKYPNDKWEQVPGNCDTIIFLGGKESSSKKYISEETGEETLDKRSSSKSYGRNQGSSSSFDKFGRKLFTPDEVERIGNKNCIVLIRGQKPILDKKIDTMNHPFWKYIKKANWNYNAIEERKKFKQERNREDMGIKLISGQVFNNFKIKDDTNNELLEENERKYHAFEFTADEFLGIDFTNIDEEEISYTQLLTEAQLKRNNEMLSVVEEENEVDERIQKRNETYISEIMILRKEGYTLEQTEVLIELLEQGFSIDEITSTFSNNMSDDEIINYTQILKKKKSSSRGN